MKKCVWLAMNAIDVLRNKRVSEFVGNPQAFFCTFYYAALMWNASTRAWK